MPQVKSSAKARQSRHTIEKLIEVAFEEFSRKGFSAASTEVIVLKSGVTRGALYHHFEGKKGLFEAVLWIAKSENPQRALAEARTVLESLLSGLRV